MSHRTIEFREKDLPLKDDVGTLGALVGEVIRDQGGDHLFERVEVIRQAAIARREGVATSRRDSVDESLESLVTGLEADHAELLVRSFASYFRLVNLAEQLHRIRRGRAYQRSEQVQEGSLLDALQRLEQAGVDAAQLRQAVQRSCFEPVFTAHPTEATRRTLLEKERRIAEQLVRRLDPSLTPSEERVVLARVRSEVTASWQTEEHPSERPTVRDEMSHVLYHLTEVLYRVVPPFYERLQDAAEAVYGPDALGDQPLSLLRFSSWVGGDMDGNPSVSATTVRETLDEHRRQILRCYLTDAVKLSRQLTQSRSRVEVSPAIEQLLERYSETMPEVLAEVPLRHRDMPYSVLMRWLARRLQATIEQASEGYGSAAELLADLTAIGESLSAHRGDHAGAFGVRRFIQRVRTFGFALATLDVRQDSEIHSIAMAELLLDDRWPDRTVGSRVRRMEELLPRIEARTGAASDAAEGVLEVFRALAEARAQTGDDRAYGPYIISMARAADDVLSVLMLARWGGLTDHAGDVPLDVAPLFETVPDLQNAATVMDQLMTCPLYRQHLEQRGNRQFVMVGYSDSNKDGGLAAARFALDQAQTELVECFARHGVRLVIFHGRGGTISRGGGKTRSAVMAAPTGTVDGHLRVTEQGEVIHAKYGLRGIALRTFESAVGAMLRATALPHPEDSRESTWREIMAVVADTSRQTYRSLVYEEDEFFLYFRQATPIDVIERMLIGSRPASRRAKPGIEYLRAIPWVFSWTQSRLLLPGWFGLGSGLNQAIDQYGRDAVAEMVAAWPFFSNLMGDTEMVLAKADLGIAERYAGLATEVGELFFPRIRQEFDLTCRLLLDLREHEALLDHDPLLQRSIRLRNPYVDPMSLMQVDLLTRWRASGRRDENVFRALLASVHGIAQGLRNTG